MRKVFYLALTVFTVILVSGCSIKKLAFNSIADMLAPSSEKAAGINEESNPMIALTGENDPQLVRDFFPTALKLYEIMHLQNPGHEGLAIMTGQLYIMYANVFVQQPASRLPYDKFDEQDAAYLRAQNFYVRGKDYVLVGLNHRYPAFTEAVFGKNETNAQKMLAKCNKNDVAALYWAGSGTLAAFSLNPVEPIYLENVPGGLAMLERAVELDPAFNNGAIWEVLTAFYAAAPESLGGGFEKAEDAYRNALEYSRGLSPSTYLAYVQNFCIPTQDSAGFDEYIDKALAIDPDLQPENRLAIILSQEQAYWMKQNKEYFILE
ncbi:TRAP transporter TatT component family protein [Brucepastera parasyntrophica]|uniref:TRAP transporter TatT component family protein n=1 Tax=Brucepastera parasyntrophica TaxID=2880008 RepID=UPI00210A5708|nr:TRAP transporter TatT component family protein [Brucepastera parasyntrophica]ULQ59516.1 TRAP transporter TatT component family protein [Brucepastera parasyntrophica]